MRKTKWFLIGAALLVLALCELPHHSIFAEEPAAKGVTPFSIGELTYQLNDGAEGVVKTDRFVSFKPGDKLTLKKLSFTTDIKGSLSCWVEAYLHDGSIGGEEGVDYKNGRTASDPTKTADHQYVLVFKSGSWTLGGNHDRVVLALIHQYGPKDKDFKIVDRMTVNLAPDTGGGQ